MSNEQKIKNFFMVVRQGLDTVVGGVHDSVEDVANGVDEFLNEWEKRSIDILNKNAGKGEEVKVEPDFRQKLVDVIKYREDMNESATALKFTLERGDFFPSTVDYVGTLWQRLPDDYKTFVKRSPESPL